MTTTNIARGLALCVLATALTGCASIAYVIVPTLGLTAGLIIAASEGRLPTTGRDKSPAERRALINSVRTRDLGCGYFLVEDKAEGTAYALKAALSAEQWDLINYKKDGKWFTDFSESERSDLYKARDSVQENIANRIYPLFEDDFDFIFLLPGFNETLVLPLAVATGGSIRNDVDGIGLPKYFISSIWPLAATRARPKLKAVMRFAGHRGIPESAPHEIAHTWAEYIFTKELNPNGTYPSGHWGYSNAGGQLGGFKYVKAVKTEGDRTFYQASVSPDTYPSGSFIGKFSPVTAVDKTIPYSDIELYLMGLKSARELRDAGFVLDIYTGVDSNYSPGGWHSIYYFSATGKTSYTIDDIIARYGPRVPDASVSQKRFKVLTVILTKEGAAEDFSGFIVDDLKWLAGLPATKRKERDGYINFPDATGGRASLEVNGLERSLKR